MKRRLTKLASWIVAAGLAVAADVPRQAPPLQVTTPDGGTMSLQSFKGKVVLLEFFLTSCPHCQRTATVIAPVYQEMRSRGLEVLAVAINPDAKQQIPMFRQRFNATYPIAIGTSDLVKTFADISAVQQFFVPYIFLIDRKGVIRYEHEGRDNAFYQNEGVNLRAELDTLLKEPATTTSKAPAKRPPKKS